MEQVHVNQIEIKELHDEEKEQSIRRVNKDQFDKQGHQWIIGDMVNAIHFDNTPTITGEDGKKPLQFVIKLYQSARENKHILFPERKCNINV